ncbi:NAD-dependent epimerase/dehydratase family protein [Deinococcus hopiensis]|uniref:Nucleoside-diphosphate-sugar epimerase n=1 Tax=Deinococcus hopiensis KR-140 TaxID=695939 RepID=A0A1W1URZ8_9DEIO|nr:NAD-dependent epimerase/dehydratase family protein [Deinococcus hopiensis]SMB83799.1 Nucleoside-diphosphate-sugar epimerase [Deinococcus hopiensis KR-140]
MTTSSNLHVVLGGTGAAGRTLVNELAHLGHRVRAVSRSNRGGWPAGVEWRAADLTNLESLRAVLADASVIYMAAQPPYHRWPEEFPALIENVLLALPSPDTRLVMVDNLYAYGPVTGPIHEGLPAVATDRKGKVRAKVADRLLTAHRAGQARVVIGRASSFFGPGVEASVADLNFFRKAAAGKAVQWPARLDRLHSLSFIEDYARGLAILGTHERALGRVWHVPTDVPLTGRRWIELVAREGGVPARPGVLPKALIRIAGLFSPVAREFGEMFYEFEEAYVLDGSAFALNFSFQPTPNEQAVRRTLTSLHAQEHTRGTNPRPAIH